MKNSNDMNERPLVDKEYLLEESTPETLQIGEGI